MAWHFVTTTDKVKPSTPFAFIVKDERYAIYEVTGSYYALGDICPHAYALLSDGFVEGDKVECPLHGAVFHIPTGHCVAPPADGDVQRYPVKVDGNQISVDLDPEV